jgi:LL-H family phage holin
MDERLFEIILMIISILVIVVTRFVIPFIKEKIGTEKLAKYEYWATVAVRAAEMLWNESGAGADKKKYVVNFLNEMFNKNKVVITEQQIEILIESAVKQMKLEEVN